MPQPPVSQPPGPPSDWASPDRPERPSQPANPYLPPASGAVPQPYQQPNQYAGQPSPGWAAPFKDISALGTTIIVLSSFLVLADLLAAATSFSAVESYREAAARGDDTGFTAHDLVGLIGLLQVPNWIVVALWLSGARENAVRLAPQEVGRGVAWCWLSWIIPIVSLWFPKQTLDDVWRGTASSLPTTSPDHREARRSPPTALWWTLWLAYLMLGAAFAVAGVVTARDDGGVVPAFDITIAVASVAALTAWIRVVRGLTRVQRQIVTGPVAPVAGQPY